MHETVSILLFGTKDDILLAKIFQILAADAAGEYKGELCDETMVIHAFEPAHAPEPAADGSYGGRGTSGGPEW